MVLNSGFEGKGKPNALTEMRDKRPSTSKTSLRSRKSEDEGANSKRPKSSPAGEGQKPRTNSRVRSKTEEVIDSPEKIKNRIPKLVDKGMKKSNDKGKLDTNSKENLRKIAEEEESQKSINMSGFDKIDGTPGVKSEMETKKDPNTHHKAPTPKIPRLSELAKYNSSQRTGMQKPRPVLIGKKPSEIPKLKSFSRPTSGTLPKPMTEPIKLPVKTAKIAETKEMKETKETKEPEEKRLERVPGLNKKKLEIVKMSYKSYKEKKIKDALKDDFTSLVPVYENELQKITQVWMNTIYCSLTMRANLVKLLFEIYPSVEREQFQTEDEKLLSCISQTKINTKLECDNVVGFIKSLLSNRQTTKDQYSYILENEETAERYNYEWRKLTRKITEFGEKAKQLQIEIPELEKKKEAHELAQREKIKNKENHLLEKDEELRQLMNQLDDLTQKETSYKGNVLLKVQDYKDIKADVISLKTMEKEFQELKAKFLDQNESYEKKIKSLELLLEEKKRILEKEREVKQQLQAFLNNLQMEQKKISSAIGKDLVQYVFGQSKHNRDKRREKLWIAAVKLVLRGFVIQMKKLERDRNKMLLELQSNDSENFNTLATSLVKKDYFIKSIKHQMNDIQKRINTEK